MKKIIILTNVGFSKRDYLRFGIEILKKEYSVSFLGTSDTEVFLTLIEKEGLTKALSRVQGMFAFALFDKKNNAADQNSLVLQQAKVLNCPYQALEVR